jgi:hypothetical protein
MEGRHLDALRGLYAEELAVHLRVHSGPPGPGGNLELADAFAAIADRATILRCVALDDEYLRFCGTEAIGRLIVEEPRHVAYRAATSKSSRRLRAIVAQWVGDPNAHVRRAAVAAICQPRLLTDPLTGTAALQACHRASESITRLPATERRTPGARSLCQSHGYCWSFAVVAGSDEGMPAFERLRTANDPDIGWIVASNLKKSRLRRHLDGLARSYGRFKGPLPC